MFCRVADFGDAPVNPVDTNDTLGRVEQFYRTLHDAGVVPVTAGADTGAQWTRLLAGGKRHSLTEMGAARRHLECHTIAMCSKHN